MSRRSRLVIVLFSLLSLLVSTAALAGYDCPAREKAWQIAQMVEAGAPCATTMSRAMDEDQPNLCHADCQVAGQSTTSLPPPLLASWMELGVVLVVPGEDRAAPPSGTPVADAPPPDPGASLAIRNCCFRI